MPVVTINTLELKEYQKKSIAKKVTEIIAKETNVPQEMIYVFFSGYPLSGIAAGGVLNSDVPEDILKTFITKDIEKLKQANEISVIKRFKAVYGQEELAKKTLMKLLYPIRTSKGCVKADIFQSGFDMIAGKLESSFFMAKEIWQDDVSKKEFESSADYQEFLHVKDHFFINEFETVEGIKSFEQQLTEEGEGKVFLTLRIKANAIVKEKVKKRVPELSFNLKSQRGCIDCSAYQGLENSNHSNVFLLDQVWEDSNMLYNSDALKLCKKAIKEDELQEALEFLAFNQISTRVERIVENGVLGDPELMAGLMKLNPDFGELCINASGVAWGKPLIDQKTKALIAIAIDVVEQITGKPFENHIHIARKQGVTRHDLEELLLFMTVYAGFNKAGVFYSELSRIFDSVK